MTYIDTIDTPLLFASLEPQPADALLDLIRAYREDPRPAKIDLGVGVFRDEHGATPIMRAVKSAETVNGGAIPGQHGGVKAGH